MATHLNWLNNNEYRLFPIHEGVALGSYLDEEFNEPSLTAIPNNILVDFKATMIGYSRIQLYIHKLVLAGTKVSLAIYGFVPKSNPFTMKTIEREYNDDGDDQLEVFPVFSGMADLSDSEYTVLNLTPAKQFTASGARAVFGIYDRNNIDGIFYFKPFQSMLEPSVVEVGGDSVTRILVEDSSGAVVSLTGDVILRSGANMQILTDVASNKVIFHAIPGDGYIDGCDTSGINVVQSINGITLRDVVMTGDSCVEVSTSGNTITISNKCSEPCCGCEELAAVTNQMININSRLTIVEGFKQNLDTSLDNLRTAITNIPTP